MAAAAITTTAASASPHIVNCGNAPTRAYDGAFHVRASAIGCAPARSVARTAVLGFYHAGPDEKTLSFVLQRRTWDCETLDFHGVDGPFHVRCHSSRVLITFTGLPQGE